MLFPVGGDVRFIDGKETLVFTGSQKAIIWLNKIFAAMHESATLPAREQLQKYARRSTSAPSRALGCTSSPGPWGEVSDPQEADLITKASFAAGGVDAHASRSPTGFTPPPHGYGSTTESDKSSNEATAAAAAATNGFCSRARKARGGPGGRSSRVGALTMTRPNLSRQRKNFLRGKRENLPSPPTASTISSRAKSCEKVRPKSSGAISRQRSCRDPLPNPAKSTPGSPASPPATAAAVADGRESPIDSQTFPVNPMGTRTRFCERPSTAAVPGPPVPERGGRKTRPASCPYDWESIPPRQNRMDHSNRLRKMSTSPFSSLGRMTRPSSAVRKNSPASTAAASAYLRQCGSFPAHAPAPSKPKSIPEMLHQQDLRQRPATPGSDRPGSPPTRPHPPLLQQQLEHKEGCNWDFHSPLSPDQVTLVSDHEPARTWAYADTLLLSRISELERAPAHNKPSYPGQESYSNSTDASPTDSTRVVQPGRRKSPRLDEAVTTTVAAVVARPATPISPDFLKSVTAPVPPAGPAEESLWRLQMPETRDRAVTAMSTPSKRFSKSLQQPAKKATTAVVSRQEKKPLSSTVTNGSNSGVHALHSLAYPDIMESTLKQLSSATRKFMSKMAGLNNKLDGPGQPLPVNPHSHHSHGQPAAIICQ